MIRKNELYEIKSSKNQPIWKEMTVKIPICPRCGNEMMSPKGYGYNSHEKYTKWYICSYSSCGYTCSTTEKKDSSTIEEMGLLKY